MRRRHNRDNYPVSAPDGGCFRREPRGNKLVSLNFQKRKLTLIIIVPYFPKKSIFFTQKAGNFSFFPIEAGGRTARAEIRLRVRLSYDIYRINLSVYQRNAQEEIMEDCIIIKPRKFAHADFISFLVLDLVIGVLIAIFMSDIVYKILMLFGCVAIFLSCSYQYFLDTKTLIVSKSGIYTEFWSYKRFYKWSDFKFIGMRNCNGHYLFRNSDWMELIFYTKKAQNPIKSNDKSCAYRHPSSFLYITFCSDKLAKTDFRSYGRICYRADKKEVLSKLAEWGIEVEKCERKI